MANHKRRRPKNRRSGCLMCKPHKANGVKHQVKVKGLKGKVDIRQPLLFTGPVSELQQLWQDMDYKL